MNFADENLQMTSDQNNTSDPKLECNELRERLGLMPNSTYKDLTDSQLKKVVEYLIDLNSKLDLLELDQDIQEDEFINQKLKEKNEYHQKHMRQISSIVSHMSSLVDSSKF